MKNILILVMMLLAFGFANAQKIWNNSYKGGTPVGTFEGGKIWNNSYKGGTPVGTYEGGKIWNNSYKGGTPVGTYEGGAAGGAAAAFILLL
jgi:hypothetical protein